MKLILLLICFGFFSFVEPHGFLIKPLPRHFIHYYKPEIPLYDKDPSALFCGSYEHQYYLNGKLFKNLNIFTQKQNLII